MARRTFDVVDVTEILIHWHAGRSQLQLSASLGVSPKTVRKYTAPAIEAGMVPGGPPLPVERWAELVRGWFPGLVDSRLRQVTWPEIAAHHELIRAQLGEVTVSTIHQRLRDEQGLSASLASVRRYVRANLGEEARRAAVTVPRPAAPPGSEGQVDYGLLGRWLDPRTQRVHRVWAFVLVLACSRHLFVRPVLRMDQRSWVAAHVAAFEFFGGCPARLVPDNLKTGVDRPDLYDPKINRSYGELAAHYQVLIDPARARKPRDKPHVERQVPYVRDSLWAGRSFTSLEEMQAAALVWCRQVAGRRSCRPLGGAAPLSVFEAVEAPALGPLPRRRSSSRSGPRRRSARTSTSRSAPPCTRCRGATWAGSSTRGPPTVGSSCSGTGS
jgi:transposase